jgi:hypothetical protein
MRTSHDDCLALLARHGLGPLAGQHRVVRARRATPLNLFAKSMPGSSPRHPPNDFDALIDELHAYRCRLAARAAQTRAKAKHEQEFSKAIRGVEALHKSYALRPIIIRKDALATSPRPAETIAKAFDMLQRGSISAAQRGTLMLRLSELTERVERFVKSHPAADTISALRAQLDEALADGHADRAAVVIKHAQEILRSGKLTPAAHMHISLVLSEIQQKLEEGTSGSHN